MKTAEQLQELLGKLTTSGFADGPDYEVIQVGVPTFIKDGVLHVSSEENNSSSWLDYHGEFRGGCAWINEDLEKFAKEHGCLWQWVNPACIALYED